MTNYEKWRFYLDSLESPDSFIEWTWYLTVSAALQRRVSLFAAPDLPDVREHIYPNQFVVFIGPPGVGKTQAAKHAKLIFNSLAQTKVLQNGETETTEVIKTGPSSITVQQLYRYLAVNYTTTDLSKTIPNPHAKGKIYIHASLAFFCGDELGNLIDKQSDGIVGFLTEAWDCGDFRRETKTQGIDIIKRLCMTLLGAATPDWVREATSNKLLKQGFAARTIFLYEEKKRKLTHKFVFTPEQIKARDDLTKHIKALTDVCGQVVLTPEAEEFIKDWYLSGGSKPVNQDKRLTDYYERKKVHLYKMAMAVHFSESLTLEISLDEVKQALAILTRAELLMHRALSFGGENPIYTIAQEAMRLIEAAQPNRVNFKQLQFALFDIGNQEELEAAMKFLVDTDQVVVTMGPKGLLYAKK